MMSNDPQFNGLTYFEPMQLMNNVDMSLLTNTIDDNGVIETLKKNQPHVAPTNYRFDGNEANVNQPYYRLYDVGRVPSPAQRLTDFSVNRFEFAEVKNSERNRHGDDNLQFLMSLLPFLRGIPNHRKLTVRNRLQRVLIEEHEKLNAISECPVRAIPPYPPPPYSSCVAEKSKFTLPSIVEPQKIDISTSRELTANLPPINSVIGGTHLNIYNQSEIGATGGNVLGEAESGRHLER